MDALVQIKDVTKRYDSHPGASSGVAARSAVPGAAVALAFRCEDRLNVSGAHHEALFASWLQASEAPTAVRVAEAITWAIRRFGTGGCVGRMAQEFGDHPEAAAERMRWVRQVAAGALAQPPPALARAGYGGLSHLPGGPDATCVTSLARSGRRSSS